MIRPAQKLQTNIRTMPMMTRIPPSEIPMQRSYPGVEPANDLCDAADSRRRRTGIGSRVDELLAIYLNDHLAGSTAGLELAKRLHGSNRDDADFGPALAEIREEIEADREALKAVMDRLGVGQSKLKPLAATVGERLGRLKPNGRLWSYSPLSRLDELELLQVGVAGKRRLWRALEHTRPDDLRDFDLSALAERATGQMRRLEALHLKAAVLALR